MDHTIRIKESSHLRELKRGYQTVKSALLVRQHMEGERKDIS